MLHSISFSYPSFWLVAMDDYSLFKVSPNVIDSVPFHIVFTIIKKCFSGHPGTYLYLFPLNKLLKVEQLDQRI